MRVTDSSKQTRDVRSARPALSSRTRRGRAVSSLMLLTCLALFAAARFGQRLVADSSGVSLPVAAAEAQGATHDFSKFSHASDAHRGIDCASCHHRADNSPPPRLPGHKACTDCHLQQFVAAPASPMCAICHTGLESRDPPVKSFPRLASFNVKFDHAQHTTGGGRPESGCAACHQPARRGVALSMPAGLDAHARCYTCHTPQAKAAGRDIASCGVCHSLAPYRRTATTAPSFRLGFSHAAHGARQGLTCASCHAVRAGLAQGAQVSAPRAAQHFPPARAQSCATCHDNRRAFGGEDFGDCKRCHTGPTFRL